MKTKKESENESLANLNKLMEEKVDAAIQKA